ncbi:hypothetical protein [Nitrosomonas ureae]|uniref:hypothetical protein n=1 Tax=Nitrosomonas ureae TaxID=44577 RepID=UPI000CDED2C0|nr:hypothetical protein [Nitrosomonas ureae]
MINWLHERITSLRGTHAFAYLVDMSQLLRSGRLVLHLVRRINQRFLNFSWSFSPARFIIRTH